MMMDGPGAEPPQGTPSRRALGAMESAVRRAREAAGPSSVRPTQPFAEPSPPPPPSTEPAAEPARHFEGMSENWLVAAVAVAATLVVIAAVALAVSLGSGGSRQATPPSTAVTAAGHGGTPGAGRHPGSTPGHRTARGNSSTGTTTSTTPPVTSPGGPPQISALSPANGAAGQGIQVAGANFLSSDGQIVATFNGQVAPTSCPAQNVCTVTVPPMASGASAEVTITTAGGTSNAVTFTYS